MKKKIRNWDETRDKLFSVVQQKQAGASPIEKINHMVEMNKTNRLIQYLDNMKDSHGERTAEYTLDLLYKEILPHVPYLDLFQYDAFILVYIAMRFYQKERAN